MRIAILDIDLGKNSCLRGRSRCHGQVILRRRMKRDGIIKFATSVPACVIAMEARATGKVDGKTVLLGDPNFLTSLGIKTQSLHEQAERLRAMAPPLSTSRSTASWLGCLPSPIRSKRRRRMH
jgi:hypothetical protein